MTIYDKVNDRLSWLVSFEHKLFNSTPADKLAKTVDEGIESGFDKVEQNSSQATKNALNHEFPPSDGKFWQACSAVSSAWNWVKVTAQETLSVKPITQEVVSKAALKLAIEKLDIDSDSAAKSSSATEETKAFALGFGAQELKGKLETKAPVGAAAGPAKPTTKEAIQETVKEGVHQAGKWTARWVVLQTLPAMFFPQIPLITSVFYLGQNVLFAGYSVGVANNFVNPARGEEGSALYKAEIKEITAYVGTVEQQLAGKWNPDSVKAFEESLAKLSRQDLLDAATRFAKDHEVADDAASSTPAPKGGSTSAASAKKKGPHMYDVKVDSKDPTKNPQTLAFQLEQASRKLGSLVGQNKPKSEVVLKQQVEVERLKFEHSLYDQVSHDEIRERHDGYFDAQLQLLDNQGKIEDCFDTQHQLFKSRADYFMQEERYTDALDMKRAAANNRIAKEVDGFRRAHAETAPAQAEELAYVLEDLKLKMAFAQVAVDHFDGLKDDANKALAVDQMRVPLMNLTAFNAQEKTEAEITIALAKVQIKVENELIAIYSKLENNAQKGAAELRKFDFEIEILKAKRKPDGDIISKIVEKWKHAHEVGEQTRNSKLTQEAVINLEAYAPDIRRANGDPDRERQICMDTLDKACQFYTGKKDSMSAQPFLMRLAAQVDDHIQNAGLDDPAKRKLLSECENALSDQASYLQTDMVALDRSDARVAQMRAMQAAVSREIQRVQGELKALAPAPAPAAVAASPSPVGAQANSFLNRSSYGSGASSSPWGGSSSSGGWGSQSSTSHLSWGTPSRTPAWGGAGQRPPAAQQQQSAASPPSPVGRGGSSTRSLPPRPSGNFGFLGGSNNPSTNP